ncbi:MAG: GGDEF domain-containing protein [Spirochaetes bacterium]|nr:GGDEF domain-containing protein [Spirochaetota bacterium]
MTFPKAPDGAFAGGSVELDALRDEYEKQIFDLKQLLEVSKSLNSTLDYKNLIDSILFTIMGQMKVLKAGLFAKKGLDTSVFSFHRNFQGFGLEDGIDYSIREDHELIKLFQIGYRSYTLAEISERLGGFNGIRCLESLDPSLVVPLKAKGMVNGIILLGDQIEGAEFTEAEREYVLNIAIFAAIAINNSFLFEMTTTDMMTKLKMKHYFYTVLFERMESAAKTGQPLSVIMCDIDHFKKFNDTYGHSCGDVVLQHVARLIHGSIRTIDLAARYGGEEFCVLLPDTDAPYTRLIAERIRKSVCDSVTEYEGLKLQVTISLGVAQYDPPRDISAKSIIDRADKALYRSKQEGRDRVTVSD